MTRKDYELIAKGIRNGITRTNTEAATYGARLTALFVSDQLATTNPRFDRTRFLKACGVSA